MEKVFRMQRVATVVYALIAILVFIFSLFFLTDFKDLFGLELKVNQDVAYFHDVILQNFNQRIFSFSLYLIVGIALSYMLEIINKVPDVFALCVMGVFLILAAIFSFYCLVCINSISSVYVTLDFSKVAMEGAIEYIPNSRTFIIGNIVFLLSGIGSLIFIILLIISHKTYRRKLA